jgi:hypothetical protein
MSAGSSFLIGSNSAITRLERTSRSAHYQSRMSVRFLVDEIEANFINRVQLIDTASAVPACLVSINLRVSYYIEMLKEINLAAIQRHWWRSQSHLSLLLPSSRYLYRK